MSALSERSPVRPDTEATRAVAAALTLAIGGGIVAFAGVIGFRAVGAVLGIGDTDAYAVADIGVQLGFAVVAAGYLFGVDDRSRYLKLRRPTIEDVVWIVALPGISAALSIALTTGLPVLGIAVPTHNGSVGTAELLLQQPMLWAVAIPALYLFAAPVEELLYRGIVQGRLRPHLGTAGVVFVSGVAFGFVWAFVYERTENLAVTAVSHAMFWTVPFSAFLPMP